MWSTLSLIESPELVETGREEEEEEEEGGQTTWLGDVEPINFPPPAYQSCPPRLSVSADDTLSVPTGPFPGREEKLRLRVCLCVGQGKVSTHLRAVKERFG